AEPQASAEFKKQLEKNQRQLQEDFAFIAATTIGGEFLDESKISRLEKLANITWWRHFDDRLGVSQVELSRCPAESANLPVKEYLLHDKPEHVIPRTQSVDYDPRLGINMDVPEHLYNLGEVYNLSI